MTQPTPRLLFVCIENACRSQMAEAIARSLLGQRADIHSAGSHPAERVNPLAIAALKEIGLTVANERPKGFDALPSGSFDYVVSMGCGDACPQIPAAQRIEWSIPDPKNHRVRPVRRSRDSDSPRREADQIRLNCAPRC